MAHMLLAPVLKVSGKYKSENLGEILPIPILPFELKKPAQVSSRIRIPTPEKPCRPRDVLLNGYTFW